MPKLKTHKGSKKRFKVSSGSKLIFSHTNKRHILDKKTAKRKRQLRKPGVSTGTIAKNIIKLLPYE